jgi:hypothetical protein
MAKKKYYNPVDGAFYNAIKINATKESCQPAPGRNERSLQHH